MLVGETPTPRPSSTLQNGASFLWKPDMSSLTLWSFFSLELFSEVPILGQSPHRGEWMDPGYCLTLRGAWQLPWHPVSLTAGWWEQVVEAHPLGEASPVGVPWRPQRWWWGDGVREKGHDQKRASLDLVRLPSSSHGASVPRPVCLGLAVRERFQSLPPQVPCFARWVRGGWRKEGQSWLGFPISWQSRERQRHLPHCRSEAQI